MTPRILPRAEHNVSRKNIDPEALKVLYRLKNNGFTGYLVGGGVRDLLLERRPKDFDVGTDAHPQQVKKLFRNCFVVGRRFRLCHIRFGRKVVEVSTFRRQAADDEGDGLIRRDNTFGTPEEDAFRRDFTVNALFYDIATFSVIDYVGGLEDLEERVIRTIGDPGVRLREDPVRMMRAIALAARLDFAIDRDTAEAIRALRGEIVKSSAPRLLEEFYKVLRQGAARRTFQMLHEYGLLRYLLPEADRELEQQPEQLLGSLGRLDDYRNAGLAPPDGLSNAILLGTLLVPLGLPLRRAAAAASPRRRDRRGPDEEPPEAPETEEALDVAAEIAALGGEEADEGAGAITALSLPFARRDLERLRLILAAQNRLREVRTSARARQVLAGRAYLDEALRWLEIHGGVQGRELAEAWRALPAGAGDAIAVTEGPLAGTEPYHARHPRRRRRRRARRRPGPPLTPQGE
jgi:poly(A) polymerase